MGVNDTKLQKCIRDLKRIMDSEKVFSDLEVLKDAKDSNLERFIEYAINNNIIENLTDVFEIIRCLPELDKTMAKCIENSKLMKKEIINNGSSNYNSYCENSYAGVYNSLSEVPGYGTEWNERCVPNGVVVRGYNSYNGRCSC